MKKNILLGLLVILSFNFTQLAFAEDFNFLEQVKNSNPQALDATGAYNANEKLFVGEETEIVKGQTDSEVSTFIVDLVKTAIGLLSVLLLIHLVVGAYHYVTSGGDEEKTKKAKATIIQAIVGFLIAIVSYSMINVVVNVLGQEEAGTDGFKYEDPATPA
ncbi:MAG: hypothetical protein PHU71_00490 [Candidatus Gracilibacteria bacterium]|nr:hypothetical protein [Candidatus Gracilibacteria bacterium]